MNNYKSFISALHLILKHIEMEGASESAVLLYPQNDSHSANQRWKIGSSTMQKI